MTRRTTRSALLARTALASTFALMIAGAAAPAFAQSTNAGTVTSVSTNGGGVAFSGATSNTGGADTSTVTLGGGRTVLNWDGFNLTSGDTLNFVFGAKGDIVVNRVGAGSAAIDGALNGFIGAEGGAYGGNVWFLAQDGVVFGANARVNVGGLLATTAGLADADVLDGDMNFAFSGATTNPVQVLAGADLRAWGGALALVSQSVSTDAGATIGSGGASSAEIADGQVLYGAATNFNITFAPEADNDLSLVSFQVPTAADGSSAVNPLVLGAATEAGDIYLAAVSRTEVVGATLYLDGGMTAVSATPGENGSIVLGAGRSAGVLDLASGGAEILARFANVAPVDADGDLTLASNGELRLGAGPGAFSAGGDVTLAAGKRINFLDPMSISVGGDYSITAEDFSEMYSPGTGMFAPTFTGGGAHNFSITDTAGGLNVRDLNTSANLSITVQNGDLTLNGVTTTGNLTLDAGTGLVNGNLAPISVGGHYAVTGGDFTGGVFDPVFTGVGNQNFSITDTLGGLFYGWGGKTFSGDLSVTTLNGGGLTINGDLTSTGGNITLAGAGGLTLQGSLTATGAGAGLVTLTGGVFQSSGAITARGLQTSGGIVQLTSAANNIDTLYASTATSGFRLVNTGDLAIVGTVDGGSGLNISTTGALTANASTLTSDNNVVLGGGSLTLNGTLVDAGTGFFANGPITFNSNASVTSGDIQSYTGTVTLGSNTTLTSRGNWGVTFAGAVNGAYALNVATGGTTTFNGAVGATTALASLTTGGATAINGGSIRTSGAQSYGGATTLGATTTLTSTGAGAIGFGGALDGGHGLTVNTTGTTSFGGAVGATTALASLTTDAGGTTVLNGDVEATGAIAFGDAVTLGAGAHGVTGADVTFTGAVNAASLADTVHLTVTATGAGAGDNVTFASGVGATTALDTLTVDGPTTLGGASYNTTAAQTWNGAVLLSGGGAKAFNGGAGSVSFNNTLDGGSTANVNAAGGITFGGLVGVGTRLTALNTSGGGVINLDGGEVRTTGVQSYSGSVVLGADAVLDAQSGGIIFNAGITGAFDLALRTPADSFLNGAVNIASLTTDAGGNTNINNPAGVTTSGNQTYGDAVLLGSNTTLTGAGLGSTTIAGNGAARDLTLNFSGATTLAGGALSNIRNLTTGGGGTTTLSGTISTSGTQTYNDAVSLSGNTVLASSGAGAIGFGGAVDGGYGLTVNTTGTTSFGGAVGATTALASLATNAGGTTVLNGDVRATGAINFEDAVTLDGAGLRSLRGASARFAAAVNQGSASGLSIDVTGDAIFLGALGTSGDHLDALAVRAGGAHFYATNYVDVLAAASSVLGGYTNGSALTVGTVDGLSGLSSPRHIDVTVESGDLTLAQGVTTGATYMAFLRVDNGSLVGPGLITAQNLIATASNGVGAGTGDRINTNVRYLEVSGGSGGVFIDEADEVTLYAGGAATRYDVTAGGTITVSGGLTAADGSVALESRGGGLTLSGGDLLAGGGGDIRLTAAQHISADPSVMLVGADVHLSAANYLGDILSASTLRATEDISITDTAGGLSLGDLSAAGNLTVTVQNGGGLTGGVLSAGTDVAVNAAGGVDLAGLVAGRDASVVAESGGILILDRPTVGRHYFVRAADFAGNALNPAFNAVTGGDFTVEDTLGGLAVGALGARGNLTVRVLNGGDFLLDPGSGGLTSQAGDITVVTEGGGALQLMGDVVTASDRTVALVSSGALAQLMGRIDTGTLTGSGAANVGLGSATNAVERLGAFSAGGVFNLVDTGGLTVEGAVSAGGNATVRTTGGDLTLAAGGRVTGALVQLATDQDFHNLRGADAVSASDRWLIYSAGPDGNTYGGLDSGATAVWGRGFGAAPGQTGNRYVFAVAPTVTFTSTGGTKTYGDDGTSLMGYTVSGLHGGVAGAFQGDTVATAFSGSAALSSAGAAERASVAGGPYVVDIAAGDLASLAGYAMAFDSAGRIVVTPKALTGTVVADDKTYDGGTAGAGTISLTGVVSGDTVSVGGATFTFADKNAGADKVVTISGATLTGTDAGNYTLSLPATALADIFKKALTGTVVADDKTYDGTRAATGTVALGGVVDGDTVTIGGTTFTFADKNAGADKVVTVSGGTLSGADAGNYTVELPATVLADIFRKAITGTAVADDKTYDGTRTGTGAITLAGLVEGDTVGASGTFTFADKNAGADKVVTVSGVTLTGTDAGNYTVELPATVLADIFKKALTGTVVADDKTYDGTTAGAGTVTLAGVVDGDTVGASGTFTFADKNAGADKVVTVSGLTLTGTDAGNYTVDVPATVLADIFRKALTGTVVADDKTYDGTTAGTGTVTLAGVVDGDTVGASGGTFTFADKNAGADKVVTVTGVGLTGADAGNYTLTVPASVLADIARRAITVTADPAGKLRGEADPALTWTLTAGSLVDGDSLTGSLVRAPGEAVGRYLIEQGDLAASDNYALTYAPGWFEIQPPAADPGVPPAQAFLQAITLQPVWTTGEGDLSLEYVGADPECEAGAEACRAPSL